MRKSLFTKQNNVNLNLRLDEVSTKEKYQIVINEKDWDSLIKFYRSLQETFSKIEAKELLETILKKDTINFLKTELDEFLQIEKKLTKRYINSPSKDLDKKRIKGKIEIFILEENNAKNNEFKLADLEAIGEKKHQIDYILKPLESTDMKRAIDKDLFLNKNKEQLSIPYFSEAMITRLKSVIQTNYKSRFFVNNHRSARSIDVADVSCFLYEDGVVILTTAAGSKYIIQYTLESLENLLNPKSFFRINRKMIVNYSFINNIKLYSKTSIAINITGLDKVNLAMVSRRKAAHFRAWLDM